MKCSKCGKESKKLLAGFDLSTGRSRNLCYHCYCWQLPEHQEIAEVDKELEEVNKLVKQYEILCEEIKDADFPDVPEEIATFMVTPQSNYTIVQMMRDKLQSTREKLLAEMPEKERLTYQIKRAVEIEDFEEAERLQGKLLELE